MTMAATPEMDSRPAPLLPWLLGVLLALGGLAIYWHVGEFGFLTFDDEHNIVFNPHLGPLSPGRVHWAFTEWGYTRRCMPLGWLGFATVFSLAGLNPAGWHLAGLGLHLVNSLLLFALLFRLAGASRPGAARSWALTCAFLGAAFWAWHPLRVESVAWATALLYGQAEFFLLLALLGFVRDPAKPSARLWALVCYSASLLTYPVAIGFAPVFALVAGWRLRDWRRAGGMALPFFVPALAAVIINVLARASADGAFIPMPTWTEFPPLARGMQAAFVWVYYAWIPFWPAHLTLFNPVLVNFDPWSAPFVLSALVLASGVVTVAAWPAARRTAGGLVLAHLCVLVPMMGLVERPYFPSDRYAAFTQAVLAAALVLGLVRLSSPRARLAVVAAGLAAGGLLGVLSSRQTEAWRDAPTALRHSTAGLAPTALPVMRYERPAVLLYRSGDLPGALAVFDQGIALLPGDRSLVAGRADLVRQGAELRAMIAAVGAPPSTPPVAFLHQELGLECARAGELVAAREHLRLARVSAPDFYAPAYNLALVELRQGNTRAALGCYLWAEARGGKNLPARSRAWVLGQIADQFTAAGDVTLAAAARARALRASRD